jgi:predicted RNase H-like nuclease (RuvC/YqgF family)
MQPVDDAASGPRERIVALAGLVATLDRRLVELFETMGRLGETTENLDQILQDGSGMVEDLRSRLDRLETRLHGDMDEIKEALLAKIGDLDVKSLGQRVDSLEVSVQNIERAVTHVDGVMEGLVETAPGFISRRVREKADRVEETSPTE